MPRTQNRSDLDTPRAAITARNSLYSDFDLNFTAHPNTGDVTTLYDINSIKQSVKNLILTNKGERPFNPRLGSNVRGLLFEPADPFTALDIREAIRETISNYEPRVKLLGVVVKDDADANRYSVEIEFQILTTLETGDVTFYLERIR